jgi:actin-related protein 9
MLTLYWASPSSLSKDDAAKTLAQIKESAKSKKSIKEQQAAIAAAAAQKAADEAAAAKAERERALDLVTCKIPALGDRQITVGPIRHRACEPLMVGKPEGGRTIPEAMAMAAESVEAVNRQQVWDGLVFCGELAEIPCECRCKCCFGQYGC